MATGCRCSNRPGSKPQKICGLVFKLVIQIFLVIDQTDQSLKNPKHNLFLFK